MARGISTNFDIKKEETKEKKNVQEMEKS